MDARPNLVATIELNRGERDLENGVENPDMPAHVDKRGHDPGVSFISVGDLAKAFYHMPVHPSKNLPESQGPDEGPPATACS